MAASNAVIDFTPLESFHLLYKNLWSMNIAYRVKQNLLDTVLYKEGKPFCWLFTSEQTGEIMKKKEERLSSINEIVKAFKLKSREFTGSKEIVMRNKIAIVWYMENERRILSHIVDEKELKTIMSNNLTEILCIQTYIGGMYFRGNGVFEHRMWTQKDGSVKHITYETINMDRNCLDRFTCESEKLVVTEHQHGALSAISKQLAMHMAFMNKCKVSGMIIVAVFSEGWVPHIIAAKKFTLTGLTFNLAEEREEMVYPTGRAPNEPTINPQSLLLPRSVTDYALRAANSIQRTSSVLEVPPITRQASISSVQPTALHCAAQDESIPPPPSTENTPATGTSTSRKVRSSSISYDRTSEKYQNYSSEQERRAAQLSRQGTGLQEGIDSMIEEAKALAYGIGSENISPVQSPPRKNSISAKLSSNSRKFIATHSSKDVLSNSISSSSKKNSSIRVVSEEENYEVGTSPTPETTIPPTSLNAPSSAIPFQSSIGGRDGITTGLASAKFTTSSKPMGLKQSMSAKVITKKQVSLTSSNQETVEDDDLIGDPSIPPPLRRALTTSNIDISTHAPILKPNAYSQKVSRVRPFNLSEAIANVPPIDPSKEPSRISYGTDDYYATVHMGAKPSALHQLAASKTVSEPKVKPATITPAAAKPRPSSSNGISGRKLSQSTSRKSSANLTGTTTTGIMGMSDYPTFGTTSPIHRLFRPDSAKSVTKLRNTIDKVKTVAGASSGQLGTSNATKRGAGVTDFAVAPFELQKFEINTEVRAAQTHYFTSTLQDHEAALKEHNKFFAERRPISAPHSTRPKSTVAKELLPPGEENRHAHLEKEHPRGFSLAKVLPLSGTLCFGSYCDFNTRAKNAATNDPGQTNNSRNSKSSTLKSIYQQRQHQRCNDCPHQMTFKSILLAKAEVKFLGSDIDENIESLLDQLRLSSVSTEQLYTYFVRRHLNRVAQKCQEEGRKLQLSYGEVIGPHPELNDLNLIYRQLVYADAMASIHPSRFYYTVPLCEMCYKVYTFMDSQREISVLHNIDNHLIATATAAASAEKTKFTATAQFDAAAAALDTHSHRIRVRLGLGHKSHHHTGKDTFHDHAAGHDGEDPYIQDDNVNTDEFIPHHSMQRDIYNDSQKKDSFATNLRKSVARIKANANSSTSGNRRGGRSLSPSDSALISPGRENSADQHSTKEATPPQSLSQGQPRKSKIIRDRDRVPVNYRADDRFNSTHDSGLGSKGPVLPDQVGNENKTIGTIENWVKLLNVNGVNNGANGGVSGANAQYDKIHGWHTHQEWDRQGSAPHLRPTSSTVNRLKNHKALQRPHSAQGYRRESLSETVAGEDVSVPSAHVKFAIGSQLQSLSRGMSTSQVPSKTPSGTRHLYETEVQELQSAIRKKSRQRPRSAGAVPYSASGKSNRRRSSVSREDSIAALEMELANKMLELTNHLSHSEHDQDKDGGQEPLKPIYENEDPAMTEIYAYYSLPFMAAPYLPAQSYSEDNVADAAYTQLQIDATKRTLIAPEPTPQQIRQMKLEAEQRALEERIAMERAKLQEERDLQIAQLQAERQALKEQQRIQRSGSLKTVPSTDFTPVSSSRPPLIPDRADADASQVSLPELQDDSLNGDNQLHIRDEEHQNELFIQEQHLLQLQQQKEFRDLQHQQQMMHQKHQQQMLQQQLQHQERLRQDERIQHHHRGAPRGASHGEQGIYADARLQDSSTPPELDIPLLTWETGGGDIRESVEMSPMSPPIFQFLQDGSFSREPSIGLSNMVDDLFKEADEVNRDKYLQTVDFGDAYEQHESLSQLEDNYDLDDAQFDPERSNEDLHGGDRQRQDEDIIQETQYEAAELTRVIEPKLAVDANLDAGEPVDSNFRSDIQTDRSWPSGQHSTCSADEVNEPSGLNIVDVTGSVRPVRLESGEFAAIGTFLSNQQDHVLDQISQDKLQDEQSQQTELQPLQPEHLSPGKENAQGDYAEQLHDESVGARTRNKRSDLKVQCDLPPNSPSKRPKTLPRSTVPELGVAATLSPAHTPLHATPQIPTPQSNQEYGPREQFSGESQRLCSEDV